MDWARLMHLGRNEHSLNEFETWLRAFEENPSRWTKYYGYQVTMQRYEDIAGNVKHYTKNNTNDD